MTFERSTIPVAIAGLVLFITGCAEDGEDAAETLTSVSGGSGTTEAPSSDGSTSAAASEDGPDPGEGPDGEPNACDPACEPGQMCVGSICFDNEGEGGSSGDEPPTPPGDDSTGGPPSDDDTSDGPPAECGVSDQVDLPGPECEQCLRSSCCEQLQGCYGDETNMMDTECSQLDLCIRSECAGLTNPMEINECASMNCSDFTGAFGALIPVRLCTNMNCQAQCT